jgi:hypothetical protein
MTSSRGGRSIAPRFASPDRLIDLDAVARRYGARPSDILGVSGQLEAWDIDQAAMLAGIIAESRALDAVRSTTTTAGQAPAPGRPRPDEPAAIRTLQGMDQPVIFGTVRYQEPAPALAAWLDQQLPAVDLEDLIAAAREEPPA